MLQECSDQAGTLRTLVGELPGPSALAVGEGTARVLSITSGKGGVGKTTVVANMALVLSRAGYKVLIVDVDLGLANVDVIFGLTPKYNLNHFFSGERSLEEIVAEGPEGIHILPAGSGAQAFTQLSGEEKTRFLEAMDTFHGEFDFVLLDTEAGISENVTYFNVAAQEILVVTTSDPTALTDAYALMKLLSTKYHEKRFNLIANFVKDEDEALDVYRRLTMVANRYLDISIDYLGCIPLDKKIRESVVRQQVCVALFPGSKTAKAFEALVSNLRTVLREVRPKGTSQFFWRRLLSLG